MSSNDSVLQTLYDLLLVVEAAMKNHYACLLTAIDTQRSVIDRMQTLAQRYNILLRGVPSKRTYPKESSHLVEDDIRTDFHVKRSLLDDSNTTLNSSLTQVKEKYCGLNEYMNKMDSSQVSTLDSGEVTRPPLVYFVELFGDFLKYFTKTQSKMNCFAGLLTTDNISSLNTYRKLLELNKEFRDHFNKSLAYCSSLHSKAKT